MDIIFFFYINYENFGSNTRKKHMRGKEAPEPIIKGRSMMAKLTKQRKTTLRKLLPEAAVHKMAVLKHFSKLTGKNLCQSLFLNKGSGWTWNFIKKETLVQMFYCELQEILTPFLWKISGWMLVYYKCQLIELKITLLPTILKEDIAVFSSALTKKDT